MRIGSAIALFLFASLAASDEPSQAAGSSNHVVNVVGDETSGRMYFEPNVLFINPGDTVTWINRDDVEHDVITFPDGYPEGAGSFQSPMLKHADDQWSHLFVKEGTYEYHCLPHLKMNMYGMIVVGRPSEQGEFHVPAPAELAAYRHQIAQWFDDEVTFEPRQQRDRIFQSLTN
jgi:pseudoazurin